MAGTGDRQLIYYMAAFVLCIFSELVFATYKSVFDTYNVVGHIYKVVAFYLIYKGLFATSVKNPYLRLYEANEKLRQNLSSASGRKMDCGRAKHNFAPFPHGF